MTLSLLLSKLPLLNALLCVGISIYVLSRDSRNRINRHFSLGIAAIAMMEFGNYMYLLDAPIEYPLFWRKVALTGEILLPGAWLSFSYSYGRAPSSVLKKRNLLNAAYLLSFGFLAVLVFDGGFLPGFLLRKAGFLFSVYLVLSLVFTVANFELTLRASDHRQRWHFKFLFLGVVLIFLFLIFMHSFRLLYPAASFDFSYSFSTVVTIGCLLVLFSLIRHSLLGVDVYVSRDMIFRSFTLGIVGAYLLAVGVIAQVVYAFGGSFQLYFTILFVLVAAVFLGSVLLSEKVRKRTRDYINRHFYRNKYEYRKEWLEWTDRLGTLGSAKELLPPVERMIYENFWITKTVLWMYDESRNKYDVAYPLGGNLDHALPAEPALEKILVNSDYPVPLSDASGGGGFTEDHERVFSSLGIATIVPLVVEGRLLGILGLSKCNFTTPLDQEDYDYLKIIGKQVANVLHRANLSEKLVGLKEKEAFHSFSAFVLHDLKNFISMLSLVLANANRNFDNPEFRKDMTASIARTVDKMKNLMDKLAAFSGEPLLRPARVDLNRMLREHVSETRRFVRARVLEEYQPVPTVVLDQEEIGKVFRNLVVNADESIPDGNGEIRIGTSLRDGKIAFTVADNGRGMSREFMERELFQLFSTTKESGFGIGLYQSRKIVEAHGGTMEVDSEEGKGSKFTVVLPNPAE
jgi:putative PEP-CTERM system histidine kinase